MSGHSKWANNKHRKASQDAKRGKVFTKIIREIVNASKIGGDDPVTNPRLRTAMDKALANNMTRDTLDRAIRRGIGTANSVKDSVFYGGYGPGGIAIMLECFSENRNRTASELRYAFGKYGGNLSTDQAVSYLFRKQGVISYPSDIDEEKILEAALEYGAHDVMINEDGTTDVYTTGEELKQIKLKLETAGFQANMFDIFIIPSTKVEIDQASVSKLQNLIAILEQYDEVQEIYHNAKW